MKPEMNILTINLEGGATQVRELSKTTVDFFKNASKESAKVANVKHDVWRLMSEKKRMEIHLDNVVHDVFGAKSFTIE